MSRNLLCLTLLLATTIVAANEVRESESVAGKPAGSDVDTPADAGVAQEQESGNGKVLSGMSILGNQEAPKSLVIVPWKSSQLGDSLGITTMLDDSRQPIDREVFMRALGYYEIRSEAKP